MKHLQYFQKRKPASIEVSVDVRGFGDKCRNGNALKKYKQTLAGKEVSSHNPNVADRIRNYCIYILMFAPTGYAVVGKFKNSFEKNLLATKEGFKILRVIFLAVRNIAPVATCPKIVTQFKTISPELYTQIDTIWMTSDTVVSALWPYPFSLWMPYLRISNN